MRALCVDSCRLFGGDFGTSFRQPAFVLGETGFALADVGAAHRAAEEQDARDQNALRYDGSAPVSEVNAWSGVAVAYERRTDLLERPHVGALHQEFVPGLEVDHRIDGKPDDP